MVLISLCCSQLFSWPCIYFITELTFTLLPATQQGARRWDQPPLHSPACVSLHLGRALRRPLPPGPPESQRTWCICEALFELRTHARGRYYQLVSRGPKRQVKIVVKTFKHRAHLPLNPSLERCPQKSDYWVTTMSISMTLDPHHCPIFGRVEPVYIVPGCPRSLVPKPRSTASLRFKMHWLIT